MYLGITEQGRDAPRHPFEESLLAKEQFSRKKEKKKDILRYDGWDSAVIAAWAMAVMKNLVYNPLNAH